MSSQKSVKDRNSLKIVLLGDRAVGKSCLAKRFVEDQFNQFSHPTVGVDFMSKTLKYDNQVFKIQLWDTAGQQKYRSLAKSYLRNANACIFVYDVTNIETYFNIPQWMNMMNNACKAEEVYSIIVGNKCDADFDLEKLQSQKEEYKTLKKQMQQKDQLMTSAKLGINVDKVFENILQNFIARKKSKEPCLVSVPINLNSMMLKVKSASGCCM